MDHLCFFCLVFVMPLCASIYFRLVVTAGKGLNFFGSRLWCLTVSLSLSHWYPESGVVHDYKYEGCSNMNASSFITFFTYMLRQNIIPF